jgi:hypothetical protein
MLRALLVVAGPSSAKRRPAPQTEVATDVSTGRSVKFMDSFDLEPRYSTSEIPGKCIKWLAEQELNNCLLELLNGEENDQKLRQKYETLLAFLKSPESQILRDESEKYLAEGKKVTLCFSFAGGKPKYELKVS